MGEKNEVIVFSKCLRYTVCKWSEGELGSVKKEILVRVTGMGI